MIQERSTYRTSGGHTSSDGSGAWLRPASRGRRWRPGGTSWRGLPRALGGSPWSVTEAELVAWCGGQDWARETRRSVYAGLRGFWRWAVAEGLVERSPATRLPAVRPSDPHPRPAPDLVYRRALAASDARTRLILRLAAEAGLRRAEIAQVHARDLFRDLVGWSLVVHGKGGKLRTVPLGDDLAAAVRLAAGSSWAFLGDDGGHLSPRWVGKLARIVLTEDFTLHTLRHRFATRAYGATANLLAVQQLLGHASPATTQRYVRLPDDALRRAAAAAA